MEQLNRIPLLASAGGLLRDETMNWVGGFMLKIGLTEWNFGGPNGIMPCKVIALIVELMHY